MRVKRRSEKFGRLYFYIKIFKNISLNSLDTICCILQKKIINLLKIATNENKRDPKKCHKIEFFRHPI